MKKIYLAAFFLAAIPMVSSAAIINFAGFSDLTLLGTQNFGDGITFSGAIIFQCCASDPSGGSLNNTAFPPPADDGGEFEDGVNLASNFTSSSLTLNFTTPVNSFSAAFTYEDGLTLTAYNSSLAVLETVNGGCGATGGGGGNWLGSGCGLPNEVLSLSAAGISSITISGGAISTFTIDDVNFPGAINAGLTPEPGTTAMALGGLGCLAAFGRRRRTVAREA